MQYGAAGQHPQIIELGGHPAGTQSVGGGGFGEAQRVGAVAPGAGGRRASRPATRAARDRPAPWRARRHRSPPSRPARHRESRADATSPESRQQQRDQPLPPGRDQQFARRRRTGLRPTAAVTSVALTSTTTASEGCPGRVPELHRCRPVRAEPRRRRPAITDVPCTTAGNASLRATVTVPAAPHLRPAGLRARQARRRSSPAA